MPAMNDAPIALITGGTRGIGRSLSLRLAKRGWNVAATYRRDADSAKSLEDEIGSLGRTCLTIVADQLQEDAMPKAAEAVKARFGRLDAFVANAASTAFVPLLDTKAHQIDKTVNVTIKTFILGVQAMIPLMDKGGSIVMVSGADSIQPMPFHGLLGACKGALEVLVKYFAIDLADRKIRVNGVNPGFVATDSSKFYMGPAFDKMAEAVKEFLPAGHAATPDEIAGAVELMLLPEASYINGQTVIVDGGLSISYLMHFAQDVARRSS